MSSIAGYYDLPRPILSQARFGTIRSRRLSLSVRRRSLRLTTFWTRKLRDEAADRQSNS